MVLSVLELIVIYVVVLMSFLMVIILIVTDDSLHFVLYFVLIDYFWLFEVVMIDSIETLSKLVEVCLMA